MNMKIDIQEFNEVLAEINDNQRESIASFLKSSDLVIWLRTALSGKFMILLILKKIIKIFFLCLNCTGLYRYFRLTDTCINKTGLLHNTSVSLIIAVASLYFLFKILR